MTNGGFNEGKGIYTSEDFRFTQKGKCVYIIMLNRADAQEAVSRSFAGMNPQIKRVDVLGKGKAKYVCDAQSLRVSLPAGTWPIPVIRVTLK